METRAVSRVELLPGWGRGCGGDYLHELERGLEVLHGVHLDSEELDPHYEANGALHHVGRLLLVPHVL